MSQVQVDQKNYRTPPLDGITIAHFITVADIERSARFYEKVFGGRVLSRPGERWFYDYRTKKFFAGPKL
jgi:predicted enzyme related to lactoylglutathione lyase